MSQRIFVKVIGFSDVERHALNTVFRLSEGREVVYSLWTPGAPDAPQVALVDGQSYEAEVEMTASGQGPSGMRLIWVGAVAPAHSWLTYTRPLRWADIVKVMDEAFIPPPSLDLDLTRDAALDLDLSVYPDVSKPALDPRSALIIASNLELRLYLRAKMASLGVTKVQEAITVNEGVELSTAAKYQLIILDLDLTGKDDWQLYRAVQHDQPEADIIVLTSKRTLGLRIKAKFMGAHACLGKPLHPLQLHEALTKR